MSSSCTPLAIRLMGTGTEQWVLVNAKANGLERSVKISIVTIGLLTIPPIAPPMACVCKGNASVLLVGAKCREQLASVFAKILFAQSIAAPMAFVKTTCAHARMAGLDRHAVNRNATTIALDMEPAHLSWQTHRLSVFANMASRFQTVAALPCISR